MKNIEKYRDEIEKAIEKKTLCIDIIEPIILKHFNKFCEKITCAMCIMFQMLWAYEEYEEPEIDWNKVPVDTPIYVRDRKNAEWLPRHFAGYKRGDVWAWNGGETSHTATMMEVSKWELAKLAEPEEEDDDEDEE